MRTVRRMIVILQQKCSKGWCGSIMDQRGARIAAVATQSGLLSG